MDRNDNTGKENSGDWNSGDWNSGNGNSGYGNSGNGNSGNGNSGYRNSGYRNSGDWNSGDRNSGAFNTNEPTVRMFNKPTDKKRDDLEFPVYMHFNLCSWIEGRDMTDKGKQENDQYKVTGGYLKTMDYKEAWRQAWDGASDEEKVETIELENFDADIFEEITGIDVRKEKFTSNIFVGKNEIVLDGKRYRLVE